MTKRKISENLNNNELESIEKIKMQIEIHREILLDKHNDNNKKITSFKNNAEIMLEELSKFEKQYKENLFKIQKTNNNFNNETYRTFYFIENSVDDENINCIGHLILIDEYFSEGQIELIIK